MTCTYDDIIIGLIIANLREFDNGCVGTFYNEFEIDTPNYKGKPLLEIAEEIKQQIYETEKIESPAMPKKQYEVTLCAIEGLKQCINTNRSHIASIASTMSEKSDLLERLTYNLENKVDLLISDLEAKLDNVSDDNG